MKKSYFILMLIVLAVFAQTKSYSQLLLHETFSYPLPGYIGGNGNAGSSSNNWMTHSVVAGHTTTIDLTAGSLSFPGLQSSAGEMVYFFSNANLTDRDINTPITTASTVAYYSALVKVIDNTQISATTYDHFLGFGATSGSAVNSFGGRLGIKSVNAGANFRFGVLNAPTGTNTYTEFAQDLNFGQTYLVVVKFDRGTSPTTATLWIDPVSTSFGGTEPAGSVVNTNNTAPVTGLGSIYLRNSGTTPKAQIDEIRVGLTWADVTPAAVATIPVSSITVTGALGATTISTFAGTLQMSAAILPINATDQTYTWSVVNGTGQATISPTGLLTAVADGIVTVKATANDGSGVFGTLVITISNQTVLVSSITVTGALGATTITTNAGTLQMNSAILPVNATNQTVTWSVINGTGTATINGTGLLTAVSNGTVTVRATANDGSGVFGEAIITLSNQNILVTSITVTGFGGATTITTLAGTLQMNAAILPVNATDQTVTWSVINGTGTATINGSGLLSALTDGTVTVKATANDISGVFGTLVITLSNQSPPVLVSSIVVTGAGNATTISTNGGTLQMNAAILPVNAANQTVTWSVINGTGTASISPTGLLTAITNGVVTVKALANDGSGVFGTLDITISNQIVFVTGITVTGALGATTITTYAGTLQMSAAILPVNATDQTVTWSVINGTGQATIDGAGLLTAVADGIVTVKATANDGSGVFGTLDITISNQTVLVSGITVTGALGATTITTNAGTLQMSAAVLPVNATNQTYTWSVTNGTGQGTINATGLLTAVADGIVTVKATANDGSGVFGTLDITITNQIVPSSLMFYEPFSYPVGDTLNLHGWTQVNTGDQIYVTPGSLSYNGLAASTGQKISFSGTGRDFQKTFTSQSAGTVYYSFIMQVSSLGTLGATGGYFAGLAANGTTFGSTMWTRQSGTDFQIGINPRTTAANTQWSVAYPINTPILVVASYEMVAGATNDVVNVWINPAPATLGLASAPAPTFTATNALVDLAAVDRFFIRQDNAINTPFIDQDEIRVGTTWADVTPAGVVTIPVTSITVTGALGATTITTQGGTLQMSAAVLPVNATDQTYTWSVVNGTGQATIDATGLLTAVADGIVTVKATANDGSGVFGTLDITLSNQAPVVLVTSIVVTGAGNATTITTLAGILQMSAAVLPVNATDQTVTWSVTNGTGQGTISATGLLTAVANGIVTVTATANDGSGVFGTLDITISNQLVLVSSITVTGALGATTISTPLGTLQMSAAVLPANATNQTYTWSVTNGTGQATIDAAGLLTAATNGIVTVKATANDASGVFGVLDITLTNQPTPVAELLYEPFNYPVGDTLVPHGWTGINSGDQIFVTAGSLSYPPLLPSIGEKISFNGLGRDFQRLFTSQSAGTVYYSFIMQVSSLGTSDSLGYFSGFGSSTTIFGATIWTKKVGTEYKIGLNAKTTPILSTVLSTSTYPLNTPVFVVVSYEMVSGTTNDVVNMWINPAGATFGALTAPTPTLTMTNAGTDMTVVDRIFVRQDSDVETPFIDQDEIRVGLDWATVTPFFVGTSAIENNTSEIKVYPNPTNGLININSGNQNSKEIRVYSNNGSLVYKTTTNNTSEVINLSDRSAGLYMIQVVDQVTGKQSNIKVQVQ
ncbi:MAG: Ig-like domain-containing protein [Bacteroidetes bacterium]|nr:Ig-like domain-containing protein [Bacteroidota bacterium]